MRFKIVLIAFTLALACATAFAQQTKPAGKPDIDEIIRRIAAAESENKIARNNYTFTQDVDAMSIGEAGSIIGRFHRISDIVYDDLGNRIEKITFFPAPTMQNFTQQDMRDLAGVQPFALSTEDLPKYQVTYVGKEKIDELDTYMFDVKPKKIIKGERYFEGRIWADDQDLQIVKTAGKGVPEDDENKFPRFESYRENIDGRYWFPTYVYADDVLEFKKGPDLHIRFSVRYANYKKFSGRIRVTDEGETATEDEVKNADKDKTPPAPVKPPEQPQPKKRP
jgi:hypothetical protein